MSICIHDQHCIVQDCYFPPFFRLNLHRNRTCVDQTDVRGHSALDHYKIHRQLCGTTKEFHGKVIHVHVTYRIIYPMMAPTFQDVFVYSIQTLHSIGILSILHAWTIQARLTNAVSRTTGRVCPIRPCYHLVH